MDRLLLLLMVTKVVPTTNRTTGWPQAVRSGEGGGVVLSECRGGGASVRMAGGFAEKGGLVLGWSES